MYSRRALLVLPWCASLPPLGLAPFAVSTTGLHVSQLGKWQLSRCDIRRHTPLTGLVSFAVGALAFLLFSDCSDCPVQLVRFEDNGVSVIDDCGLSPCSSN